MKAQLGFLREHVDLPESPEEVAARLTSLGFAVEGVEGDGDEAVLDVDVTSNRPDALSHVGLARELAASLGRTLRVPEPRPAEESESCASAASVVVEAPDLCPRYAARVVRGVAVGPSPAWMARRLEACGIRPINVVVDVTNYVLLELGHPLHAFDLERLAGRTIVVRRAREGESMATLDGAVREMTTDDLLIADVERGVAVAGIMGGADTEIRAATRDVLLESAWFLPRSVRRTARRLGLQTEASHRFERGADVDVVPLALDRAAALVAELSGGRVLAGRIDACQALAPPRRVVLAASRVERLAGVRIPAEEMERVLRALGFEPARSGDEAWVVEVPRRRGDVTREPDLVEEVLRHHGFDAVPETLPPFHEGADPREPREEALAALRLSLVASGHHQAVHYSFGDPREMDLWADSILERARERTLVLDNPLGEQLAVMRTSLVPGLLRAVSLSVRRGEEDVRLFEEGRTFLARDRGAPAPTPAEERHAVAIVQTGRRGPSHFLHRPPEVDLLALAGALTDALAQLGERGASVEVRAGSVPNCAGAAGILVADGRRVGWFGRVHPSILAPLEIGKPLFAAEVDLEPLLPTEPRRRTYTEPSRFPRVVRDVSLLVDRALRHGDIIAAIRGLREGGEAALSEAIESFELVDRYDGQGIPPGKVSLTFSLSYRRHDRTLTQDEVDAMHLRLVALLERRFAAVRR